MSHAAARQRNSRVKGGTPFPLRGTGTLEAEHKGTLEAKHKGTLEAKHKGTLEAKHKGRG